MTMDLKQRANQLTADIPALALALKDRRTPLLAKVLAGLAVAYALSPIDLIPDFLPVIGYLDDVLLLPVLVAWSVKMIPPQVFAEHRANAAQMWQKGQKHWYYALPVVAIWALVLLVVLLALL